jgi:hypothetical protein
MTSAGPKGQIPDRDLPDEGRGTERHCHSDTLLDCAGEVVEVLDGFGLAHIRTADGALFGINLDTQSVDFAAIRTGMRFCIVASARYNRVVRSKILDPDES